MSMARAIPPGGPASPPPTVDWPRELAAHAPWLRGVIAVQGVEPGAVEDVFQEVAAAAIEQRSPLTDATKARGWLYRLAVIHAARHRRRWARRRRHEAKFAQELECSADEQDHDIPLVWLLSQERRELLRAALARLPDDDARLLREKYFAGRSYRDLAGQLGISEKAVDSRLHRARQRLRDELDELSDEEAER
jgi:RNA polymerase sigma-70 factor, ECF subfamily